MAAVALVFVPRNYRVIIRAVALLATFISMLLAVKMFCQFVPGQRTDISSNSKSRGCRRSASAITSAWTA